MFPVWIIACCLTLPVWSYQRTLVSQCIAIREPICQGNYNYTSFPNILGHENHEEASARLAEFAPLIDNSCSLHVKFFLCSLHFPMCDSKIPYGIPACREMCEDVRLNCEPYLKAFHLQWPETIECQKLPPASSRQCLVPRSMAVRLSHRPRFDSPRRNPGSNDYGDTVTFGGRKRLHRKSNRKTKERKAKETSTVISTKPPERDVTKTTTSSTTMATSTRTPETQRRILETTASNNHRWSPINIDRENPLRHHGRDYDYDGNRFVATEAEKWKCKNQEKFVQKFNNCLPLCDVGIDVMFSTHDKTFMYYWMMTCSILCVISSTFTVGTFLIDSKRFRYPERPIIFLSLCYLLYAIAYLVRLGRGSTGSVSCVTMEENNVNHLVVGELESTGCTAVFFLLYYFGMAAAAWWVVLSLTWFLAAGLKWGHEAIEANGFCFHLAAWLLPAIQTILVLVLGKVDGDELTGLCYVGNLNKDSLLYFIIIPLVTYLAVGSVALGCGFLSLLKIRRVMKKTGEDSVRLEKLILKIGIFTLLYIVPTSCVVAVNMYQYNNMESWKAKSEARPCYPAGFLSGSTEDLDVRGYYPPRYRDYSYDETFISQSSDYPSFNYRSYDERRRYPDIYNSEYGHRAQSGRYAQYHPYYRGRGEAEGRRRTVRSNRYRYNDRGRIIESDQDESTRDCHLPESIPSFPIFAIKIFMSLVAGITSGIWVWSRKTYRAWKMFCNSSWCGPWRKGSDLAVNTQRVSSSGNLNIAPSVSSHLLHKPHGGEYLYDNRFSIAANSPDLNFGYCPVNQDDDDVIRFMTSSQIVSTKKTNALTLGDIAKEHLDSELMNNPRGFGTSEGKPDDVIFYKHTEGFKETQKLKTHSDKPGRAVPNNYVDHRGRFYGNPPLFNEGKRVRKYSEGNANRLHLISQSGFNPLSSTRRKAESAHVRCTQQI